ncbi:MAG: UDP-N-acetylmuramoyl-L-alanine--D-glutamate ligase [Candidatus Omnitrophota bacterium]|nr:UDP-N-acetylmuramoyl-L-alanine--D-glutamate ligase [Candidatus Omnitrophota bacterium]
MDLRNKKVIVIGAGRSGKAAARLLLSRAAEVDLSDSRDDTSIREELEPLARLGVKMEFGGHREEFIQGHQIAVLSPGVRQDAKVISWLKSAGTQIVSEIELAYRLFKGEVIAITGTNGKTTVTALIGKILKDAGKKALVCGNIGNSFSNEAGSEDAGSIAVIETSSFQLEWTKDFRPRISVLLNITDDHLDRYRDFSHYQETKFRIFLNQQKGDFCLLNSDQPYCRQGLIKTRAKILYFDKKKGGFDLNQRAAMLAAGLCGVGRDRIIESVKSFRPFEHRMEYVDTINGVKFINDSKSTNVGALKWALEKTAGPVILIAGGRDKKNDFGKLRPWIKDKVKEAVLIGEAGGKLKKALNGLVPLKEASTFNQAFDLARSIAGRGEIVLLSPACASFDMFSDFEERGRVFKDLVIKCKKQKGHF